jgi:hypothetical protein
LPIDLTFGDQGVEDLDRRAALAILAAIIDGQLVLRINRLGGGVIELLRHRADDSRLPSCDLETARLRS